MVTAAKGERRDRRANLGRKADPWNQSEVLHPEWCSFCGTGTAMWTQITFSN